MKSVNVSKQRVSSFLETEEQSKQGTNMEKAAFCMACPSARTVEATCSFERPVDSQRTRQGYIPEHRTLQQSNSQSSYMLKLYI
jgi:hypothetical protein